MTLEELQQQAEKDLKMDDLELGDESLKSASLHQKYLTIYNTFRQLQLMNEGTYRVLYRKKWEYYGGKSDPYLESDEELIKAKQKVEYYKMCTDSCERILKQIQSRGWDIKNAIEWRKFVDGAI